MWVNYKNLRGVASCKTILPSAPCWHVNFPAIPRIPTWESAPLAADHWNSPASGAVASVVSATRWSKIRNTRILWVLHVGSRNQRAIAYISYMYISYVYIYIYDLITDTIQISIEAIQEYLCMSVHDVWSEMISIHCRFEGKPPKHIFYTHHIFDKSTQFDIKPIKSSSQLPALSHPEKGHVQSHSADSQCTCVSCIFVPPALFWLSGALFSPSATESDTVQSIIFEH